MRALPRLPDRGWLCVQGCYNIDSDLGGRDAALMLDEAGYREAIALCAEVPPHPTSCHLPAHHLSPSSHFLCADM